MIALEGGGLADLRDPAMVATGYDSVARRRELSRIRVDDLDFDPALMSRIVAAIAPLANIEAFGAV